MFIKNNLDWISVGVACNCLSLTRSCYYDWLNSEPKRIERNNADAELVKQIESEHLKSKQRYGSIKIKLGGYYEIKT